MSTAAWLPAAAGLLVAGAVGASLWRGARPGPRSVRRAHAWFAVAALCWAAGLVIRQSVPPGQPGSATVADVLPVLALCAAVAGMHALARGRSAGDRDRLPPGPAGPQAGRAAVRLADGYLVAAALFLIGWVTIFAADYSRLGTGPGTFAAAMIHPLADAAAVGWVLPVAVSAGRRAIAPCLALLVMTASDALDVAARVSGDRAGLPAQLLLLAAVGLLGTTPLAGGPRCRAAARRLLWVPAAVRAAEPEPVAHPSAAQQRLAGAVVAAAAAAAAALAVMAWGLAGSPGPGPVVALVGGSAVVALAIRAAGLAWRQRGAWLAWAEAGEQFRELADRTSDVVLVTDLDGTVRYASPAVSGYGYSPDSLMGKRLADLLHPEDRLGGLRAARDAAGESGLHAVRYPCRVRAEDGTWRHVQATLSRHRYPGAPARLLITARDVSDQVALRRQVAHLTFHDGLTGLPNRAFIEDRARTALSTLPAAPAVPEPVPAALSGIILLDLDGFTAVNDSAGHSAGDLILAQAARRLRAVLPPADTVARWGGDEFAVLIERAATAREVIDIAERLAASVSVHPFRVGDREVTLTASTGVALADGGPPGYVWRNADAAMSRAKDAGGGQVVVYSGAGEAGAPPRLALAGTLQAAIAAGRLPLTYQPVVELATGRVAGAVARVTVDAAGVEIPDEELLSAAEISGLSVPLGEWVLRHACAQAGEWHRAGRPAAVWVKVSPAQVVAPRFAESVLAALAAASLPAASLTLEAAERDLVHGGRGLLPGLAEARAHGVRLAIGDFGTDYASLSYLRRRPVDVVKIGPELVAGLGLDSELAKLVEVIVRAGRDLGIEVVAAGISHPRQLLLLRAMGCEFGQGGLIAPAVAASALPAVAGPAGAAARVGAERDGEAVISHGETKLLSS